MIQKKGPNARGKPRRSAAEGTNSVAVGVGLTNQLGRSKEECLVQSSHTSPYAAEVEVRERLSGGA